MGDEDEPADLDAGESSWSVAEDPTGGRSEAGASDISFVGVEPKRETTQSRQPTLTGVKKPQKRGRAPLEDNSTATMAHPGGHPAELDEPSTATMAHPASHPAGAPEDFEEVSTASMAHPAPVSETDVDALAEALQAPAPPKPEPPQPTADPKPVQHPAAAEHLPAPDPKASIVPLRPERSPSPAVPTPPLPPMGEDPHPTVGVLLKVRSPFTDPTRITVSKRELLAVSLGEHPEARRPKTPEEMDAWADQESVEMSFDDLGDELFDGTEALTGVGPYPEPPPGRDPSEAATGVHDPADAPTGVHHQPPRERPAPPPRPSTEGPDPTRFGQDITAPGAGTDRSAALRARRMVVDQRAASLGGSGKLLGHTLRKNLGIIPNSGHSGELDRIPLMQCFSPAGAKQCQPLGLRTLADWVTRAVHFVGRKLLAEALGLPTTTVLLATLRAELLDLPVTLARGKPPHPKDVRLLARMGIYSVHDLARINAAFEASPQRVHLMAELMSKLQKQVPQWKGKIRTTRHDVKEWAYAATKRGSDILLTPTHPELHWECAADAVLAWYLTHRTPDPQLVFDEASLRLVMVMGEHNLDVDSSTLDQLNDERQDPTDLNEVLAQVRSYTSSKVAPEGAPSEDVPPTQLPYLRYTSRNTDWMMLEDLYPWAIPNFDGGDRVRCFWLDPVPTQRAFINAGGPSMTTMDPVYLGFDGRFVAPQPPPQQ